MVLGLPALPPKPSPRKGALRGLTLASLGLAAQNAVSGSWAAAGCVPPVPLESSQMHNAQQHWQAGGLVATVLMPRPPQPEVLPQQQQQQPAAPLPAQQQEQRQPSTNSAAGVSRHSGEHGHATATKRGRQPEASAGRSSGAAAVAGASSQPPRGQAAKRRRRGGLPPGGRGASAAAASPSASPADLVGAVVEVPGSIFSVDPRTRFVGVVTKPERGRGMPAVELRFKDGDVYWFPAKDVKQWIASMVRRGAWLKHNPQASADKAGGAQLEQSGGVDSSPPSDAELEAAEALQSFSLSVSAAAAPTASGSVSTTKHQHQACSRPAMVVEDGASSPPPQQLEQHQER